jgi:RimJ/RimL family protein N-acetyltransferase
MFAPDFPVLTERLMLRPLAPDDLDALLAYQSRADVCRYIPGEPRTRTDVAARIARTRTALDAEGQALLLAVVSRSSHEVLGDVMLAWTSEQHRSGEIGYVFHPEHHGRGYATETARALLRLAFEGLGLHRVIARIDQRNGASAGVAERLGMRREAVLVDNEWFKGGWATEVDYAILEREWRGRSS